MNQLFRKGGVIIAILSMVSMVSGVVMAADTNTLTVSGNVVGTCKFSSATSSLAFGALDPSSGAAVAGAGSSTFWCTKGVAYTISDDGGLFNSGGPRMQHGTDVTEFIPYGLTLAPLSGTGSGPATPVTLNITGNIAFADYSNALAGAYSDTVVITVNP